MSDLGFFGSALIAGDEELKKLRKIFEKYWKERTGVSYEETLNNADLVSWPEVGPWEAFVIGHDRGENSE